MESINFRSVKVRTFDRAVVTVPNSSVSGLRFIDFPLTVEYSYAVKQLEACAAAIRRLLEQNGAIESGSSIVALNSMDDSGPTFSGAGRLKAATSSVCWFGLLVRPAGRTGK